MPKMLQQLTRQFFDNAGHPLSGGQLFIYVANINTLASIWPNEEKEYQLTNPLILSHTGEVVQYFLEVGDYDILLFNKDNQLQDRYPITIYPDALGKIAQCPIHQFKDSSNNPVSYGKVKVYKSGTYIPVKTYNHVAGEDTGLVEQGNEYTLDAYGQCNIYVSTAKYRIVVEDSNGQILSGYPKDDVQIKSDSNLYALDLRDAAINVTIGDEVFVLDGTGIGSFDVDMQYSSVGTVDAMRLMSYQYVPDIKNDQMHYETLDNIDNIDIYYTSHNTTHITLNMKPKNKMTAGYGMYSCLFRCNTVYVPVNIIVQFITLSH